MDADRTTSVWRDKSLHKAMCRAAAIAFLSASVITSAAYVGDTYCLQSAEAETITRYETATESLEELDARVQSANALTESDVEDAALLDDFHRAWDEAENIRDLRPGDIDGLPIVGSHGAVERSVNANESLIADLDSAHAELVCALDAVEDSRDAHVVRITREGLEESQSEGQSLYDWTEGRVSDDDTRKALKFALDRAKSLLDGGTIDAPTLDKAKESLDSARDKVEDSNSDWEAAQQRAAQARTQAVYRGGSSSGGGYRGGSGNGAWNVRYRGTDDRSTANADGSVSEWKDGYYIAHDWSYGGGQIASKPGTVVVNGRTYRYVSSMVVSRDTTWSQVSGFVYANGGIGFQTCYGNGYLITHYEPV